MQTTEPLLSASIDSLLRKLQVENEELKKELSKKQQNINQTNAYWKGKVFRLQKQLRKRNHRQAQQTSIAILSA